MSVETHEPQLTPQQQSARGLRELADLYESVPDLPVTASTLYIFTNNPRELRQAVLAFRPMKRSIDNKYINFRRRFGPITIEVTAQRENVCERIFVGEKIIPAKPAMTVPAQPEKHYAEEPEHTEAIYEWQCPGFNDVSAEQSASL